MTKVDIADFLSKHAWSLFLLIAGIAVLIATFVNTIQDTNQKDKIEKLITSVRDLAENDRIVTERLRVLAESTDKISQENLSISESTEKLTADVQKLAQQINALTIDIDKRTAQQAAESLISGELKFTKPSNNDITIRFGGNSCSFKLDPRRMKSINDCISTGDEDVAFFGVDNNYILISLSVYDLEGNLIIQIDRNRWRLHQSYARNINYDNHGFEVRDNRGNIALSIIQNQNDGILSLQGIFPMLKEVSQIGLFIAGDGGITRIPVTQSVKDNISAQQHTINAIHKSKLLPYFKYDGSDWLHKRVR